MLTLILTIARLYMLAAPAAVCSWYGEAWNGNITASGTVYNCSLISCAHRTLPLGTVVRFWNSSGDWLTCRVEDRGPYVAGRDFDLSTAAFDSLADLDAGTVTLRYRIIGRDVEGLVYNLGEFDSAACERERLDRW
jgi:rare lipoprotein A